MSEFQTYRVRFCASQALAINISARNADDACKLAQMIKDEFGPSHFEEIDRSTEHFEAQLLDTAERSVVSTTPAGLNRKGKAGAA